MVRTSAPNVLTGWAVHRSGPIAGSPPASVRCAVPVPGPGELLLPAEACDVCHADLHLAGLAADRIDAAAVLVPE